MATSKTTAPANVDPETGEVSNVIPGPGVRDSVATFRGETSGALARFKAQAQAQAVRLEAATIVLDVGQHVGGLVRKRGKTVHPQWGEAPVILFEPGQWFTDVPVTWAPDGQEGMLVEDIPENWGVVLVGIGEVLRRLFLVSARDMLYVERHDDAQSGAGLTYRNYSMLRQAPGERAPIHLQDIPNDQVQAMIAGIRSESVDVAMPRDEEPFGV